MTETVKTRAGLTLKIVQDEDALDPRKEFDNFGKIVCWHRRYSIGDDHNFKTPSDFLDGFWKENGRGGVLIAVRMYDHSGISLSTSNGYPFNDVWDSGQVGWTYATAEMIRQEYDVKRITKKTRDKVVALLKAEVETLNQFVSGDVWGYVIEDEVGEVIDSCWGFFGYDYCEKEAKEILTHLAVKAEAMQDHVDAADETEQTENDLTA